MFHLLAVYAAQNRKSGTQPAILPALQKLVAPTLASGHAQLIGSLALIYQKLGQDEEAKPLLLKSAEREDADDPNKLWASGEILLYAAVCANRFAVSCAIQLYQKAEAIAEKLRPAQVRRKAPN